MSNLAAHPHDNEMWREDSHQPPTPPAPPTLPQSKPHDPWILNHLYGTQVKPHPFKGLANSLRHKDSGQNQTYPPALQKSDLVSKFERLSKAVQQAVSQISPSAPPGESLTPSPGPSNPDKLQQQALNFNIKQNKVVNTQDKTAAEGSRSQGPGPEASAMPTVKYKGKNVKPGNGYIFNRNQPGSSEVAILDHQPDHFIAVPKDKLQSWTPEDLIKLPRQEEVPTHGIASLPEREEDDLAINAAHGGHGIFPYLKHKDVADWVHGMDFSQEAKPSEAQTLRQESSSWMKMPDGTHAFVKIDPSEQTFYDARKEALYHNLAKDYFGLGEYMQKVAAVRHPKTGAEMAAIEGVPGGKHHYEGSYTDQIKNQSTIDSMAKSGELHKLALMNAITGNTDRHLGNFMYDKDNKLKLIDHGFAFSHYPTPTGFIPSYLQHHDSTPLHSEAVKWVNSLSEDKLREQLTSHKVPYSQREAALTRLYNVKRAVNTPGTTIRSIFGRD